MNDANVLRHVEEALKFGQLEEVRNDLCKFIEYTQVDEMGKPIVLGEHHREWLKIIWEQVRDIVEPGKWPAPKISNLLLFAPRNHGKTTITVACLQFFLGKNPRLRIKYVSKSDKLSRDVLGQVSKNIDLNLRLQEVFPNLKRDPNGSWSSLELDVLKVDVDGVRYEADLGIKDASLAAYGITSPATGGRADLIVFDDIIGGRETIYEPGRLEKITKAFYTDWLSIGGKRHIVIGTPWTSDDILAQLSENPRWNRWRKPAIDTNGNALWPQERPIEWLMEKKEDVGDVAFGLQYMLEGIRPKSDWWTDESIDACKDHTIELGQIPNDFNVEGLVVGFDPAASLQNNGSYSCIFALVYDEFRRKMPFRIIRERKQPREMAEKLIDLLLEIDGLLTKKKADGKLAEKIKVSMVSVENNATQQSFVDLVNLVCENRGISLKIPIQGTFTGSANKWGPESGVIRMAAEFSTGKWIIPYGGTMHHKADGTEWSDPLHTCPICSWVREMSKYGDSGSTTDMIMAAWMANAAIDMNRIGDLPVRNVTRRVNVSNVSW